MHLKLQLVLVSALWATANIAPALAASSYLEEGQQAQSSGNLKSAEEYFRQAVKQSDYERQKGAERVKALSALAGVLVLEARSDEAIPIYKRSLSILKQSLGSKNPGLVPTMLALGSIYESDGDHARAMVLYNQVLAISEVNFGPQDREVAKSLHHLARVKQAAGMREGAEGDYKRALSILRQKPSQLDTELSTCLRDYAELLRSLQRQSEAKALDAERKGLYEVSSANETKQGEPGQSAWQNYLETKASTSGLARINEEQKVLNRAGTVPFSDARLAPNFSTIDSVLQKQNRFAEAEPLYRNLIAIDEKALGPNHPGVALDLSNLAMLLINQKRCAEAEPLLKKALAIYESNYGVENLLALKTRKLLAIVYEHQGSLSQAESYYKKVLDLEQSKLGPNDLETAKTLNSLAFLYFKEGKYADADTTYKWAVASTEGAVGNSDALLAACLSDYAQVLRKLNRAEEAEQLEVRASAIRAKSGQASASDKDTF